MNPAADENSLGNMLLSAGVITVHDLRDALDHAFGSKMLLGEALIDLGRVDQHLIDTVLAHQSSNRTSGAVAKSKHQCVALASARAAKRAEIDALDDLQKAAIQIIRSGQ